MTDRVKPGRRTMKDVEREIVTESGMELLPSQTLAAQAWENLAAKTGRDVPDYVHAAAEAGRRVGVVLDPPLPRPKRRWFSFWRAA